MACCIPEVFWRRACLAVGIAAPALLASGAVEAQAEPASTTAGGAELEAMEVAGPRIRQIDVQGQTPVISIDREQIENSGYTSLAELLRQLPEAGAAAPGTFELSGGSLVIDPACPSQRISGGLCCHGGRFVTLAYTKRFL